MFWSVSEFLIFNNYFLLYSAFRTNMHGSVCLFSKYLQHLLEGENLNELDISSASSSNNIFRDKKTLSTGWTGTCPVLLLISSVQTDIEQEISSINSIMSSVHQNTINSYELATSLLDDLYTVNTITADRPSGSSGTLTPVFESEFGDKTNTSLIGGEIYNDFVYKLKPYIEELNGDILTEINDLINRNTYQSTIDTAYSNFAKFDTAVATTSNIMNGRIIDLKDYFLTLQFLLMFFTWAYFIFFIALAIIYIIYAVKEYEVLYYIIIVLVNILFVMMLLEIFLSSFFGQVRLICHEVPRAMNFIFTGTYMVSGNSASYPAQFGRGDENMTKMFTTCLNGDGDLYSLFIPSNYLDNLDSLQSDVGNLYNNINDIISKSNIITNDYNSIENSIFLKGINKLEVMHDNLFIASEGFGDDDIYNILSNIRENLDSENCSMTYEYYVVRESDCPSGSTILNVIYNTSGVYHCYIIQNLADGASASYSDSSCGNDYINTAITFIKQINTLLEARIDQLKNLQTYYSATFKNLSNEIDSLSQTLNSSYSEVNDNLNLVQVISNCGSSRFDLIDFSDFIGDTTEYDARLIVIFSAFLGVFGFVLLYSFLVVINGLNEKDYDSKNNDNYEDYGYNFGDNKRRNINIRINKAKQKTVSNNYYDRDDEEEDDDNQFIKKKGRPQPKTGQKVEMSYINKNNEDSDSS